MMIFVTGLSVGITVLVGRRIGEKSPKFAGRAIESGICLFAVTTVVLTVGMTLFARLFKNLIAASEKPIPKENPDGLFSKLDMFLFVECEKRVKFLKSS